MLFDKINDLAREKNLTIMALEKKAGIANGAIGKWKTGSPNLETLKKVADALEVPLSSLID